VLTFTAILVLAGFGWVLLYWLLLPPVSPADDAVSGARLPTPVDTATLTLSPTPVPSPTSSPEPTPTGTRVVQGPPPVTPTPTRANCQNEVYNFEASNAVTSTDVRSFLRREIPEAHLENCRGIEYHHQLAAVHGEAILGNFSQVYRKIHVYAMSLEGQSSQAVLDTVTHEIGHNVYFNLWREDFDFDRRWDAIHRRAKEIHSATGAGFVSEYAQTDRYEDFAESYLAYIRYPTILQVVSPEKYEYLRREVFAGREYTN
jgi:hypothetical protein